MQVIRRKGKPPEHYVLVPLDAAKAAKVIQRAFTAEQVAEIVRKLHWERDEDGRPK